MTAPAVIEQSRPFANPDNQCCVLWIVPCHIIAGERLRLALGEASHRASRPLAAPELVLTHQNRDGPDTLG
jgi:hypothetical protein